MSYYVLRSKLAGLSRISYLRCRTVNQYSTKSKDNGAEVPVNPLAKVYSATYQKENGAIYDKKPHKFFCEEGKVYNWCLCGHSKNQPFCDGTHNNIFLKIKIRPIKFTVTKSKNYWLCNCKQTRNRPFCDGTHKREDIAGKKNY
ncbi:CDGSH iron-sulfur domain-containing protein 3, mitochondrial [Nasonia vitripennis]|uniref:Iron-binding zinc finger CDGSH type domain-containing protein n=1 Tax=Nasonia vitripennis TaxID=7425 RepID=A0A7M7LNE9_NASVI|nr:CDGSH iron-sulfur domain-containing protein 3, mitochondrial [Nasonia vitripennis]